MNASLIVREVVMIQCCGITCSGGPVIYATISDAFEMKIDSEMESQVRFSLSQIV